MVLEFAHWTGDVFLCITKGFSRIFDFGLVWGWTTVPVDSELGKRDNMEDDDEPGITLVAVNRGEKEELLT